MLPFSSNDNTQHGLMVSVNLIVSVCDSVNAFQEVAQRFSMFEDMRVSWIDEAHQSDDCRRSEISVSSSDCHCRQDERSNIFTYDR